MIQASVKDHELCDEGQLIDGAFKYEDIKMTGIYFLLKGERIVYVGQSTNLHTRLSHHQSRIDFDSVSFVSCDQEDLDVLESMYIHRLKPEKNGSGAKGSKRAPFKIDQLNFYKGEQHEQA